MSHFILPLTVESRKILFIDLFRPKATTGEYQFSPEDEYIAELPGLHRRTILSISRSKFIQSLHEKMEDFLISKLGIELDFSAKEKLLTVKFSDIAKATPARQQFVLGESLVLHAITDEASLYLELENLSHLDTLNPELLKVNFIFSPAAEQSISYGASIRLYLVRTADILLTGFDFGSEASQISEGTFTHSGEGTGIDQHHIELFTDMKERLGNKLSKNEEYVQYEDEKLYKSIFYLRKTIELDHSSNINNVEIPANGVNVLTLNTTRNNSGFFTEWSQVPNLKLINENPDLTNGVQVNIRISDKNYPVNLTSQRANVYAALLREMLLSYLEKKITADVYLRFTLLVPNIYTAGQIRESRRIIRKIITDPAHSFHKHIKGLEISSISESDASFLGYLANTEIRPGDYYIVIDCGKGTTDLSVVQADESNVKAIRSIYRNGFAGAGNLVTFALIESLLHFLKTNALTNEAGLKNFNDFVQPVFTTGSYADIRWKLFDCAEGWKKKYNVTRTQADVEYVWREKEFTGGIKLENLFSSVRGPEDILSFLRQRDVVYDWGGHIETAISNIVEKLIHTLSPVVSEMAKKGNCGGILLTGRGFMFKPLEHAVASAIKNIKGLEKAVVFDTAQFNLKEICLNGVFAMSVLSYNEIVSIPIEIKKGELRKFRKSDIKNNRWFGGVGNMLRKLAGDEGESFDENLNRIIISNLDFANCQFLIGGNIYQPKWDGEGKFADAVLIRSREGFFIRATDGNGRVRILELEKVGAHNNAYMSKEFVAKSLFPGWSDPGLLNVNVNH